MDPTNNVDNSGLAVPVPQTTHPVLPLPQMETTATETTASLPALSQPSTTIPSPAMPPNYVPPVPSIVATPTTSSVVPQTAEDSDLIEKEWVDKAKKIVQATADNPYEQSRELTSLKADYMKKRYNKDIRLGE